MPLLQDQLRREILSQCGERTYAPSLKIPSWEDARGLSSNDWQISSLLLAKAKKKYVSNGT